MEETLHGNQPRVRLILTAAHRCVIVLQVYVTAVYAYNLPSQYSEISHVLVKELFFAKLVCMMGRTKLAAL